MNFKANILLILPLYILKHPLHYFSTIYQQNYNLHFQPSIGVPTPILERVRKNELGDAVIINADSCTVLTPFDDVNNLPNEVKDTLQKGLKSKNLLGDAVAR